MCWCDITVIIIPIFNDAVSKSLCLLVHKSFCISLKNFCNVIWNKSRRARKITNHKFLVALSVLFPYAAWESILLVPVAKIQSTLVAILIICWCEISSVMPRAQLIFSNLHRASIAFYWIFEESWRNIFETTLATGPRFFPGIIILDLAEVQPG